MTSLALGPAARSREGDIPIIDLDRGSTVAGSAIPWEQLRRELYERYG